METLTSGMIHDIIVNECVLESARQLRQVTDNRYLYLFSFHNKVHLFSGENLFSYFLSDSKYIHTSPVLRTRSSYFLFSCDHLHVISSN